MRPESTFKEHRYIIALMLVFSCLATYYACSGSNIAFGFPGTEAASNGNIKIGDIYKLSGSFAPLISVSGSPFIALTILSGAGTFLNSGLLNNPMDIPFSETLMQLPISQTSVFIVLLVITAAKLLLSMFGASKVFSDVTLGKLENLVGMGMTITFAYLASSVTAVYAAEITATTLSDNNIISYLITNVVSFAMTVFAYVVYIVMKTMIMAADVLAFLTSPIPGTTAIFTIIKHFVISAYTWYTLANPVIAAIIGIICLLVACIVFRAARRIELYYRKIYLIPFFNALFRKGYVVALMPKKLPYGLTKQFNNVELCVEGFFMNKTSLLYKREICYFVRSENVNYIFKKRLLSKKIIIKLKDDAYVEKCFRFVRIFTDEELHKDLRTVNVVVRREHRENIPELMEKAGLINYNMVLEERRRKKAEEMALKTRQVKDMTVKKISETGKAAKNVFGKFFISKCKICGAEVKKGSKFCSGCGTAL